jgi:hypothetical protein
VSDEESMLEEAWGLLANVSGGDLSTQSEEWRHLLQAWSDRFHAWAAECFWCGHPRAQHGADTCEGCFVERGAREACDGWRSRLDSPRPTPDTGGETP